MENHSIRVAGILYKIEQFSNDEMNGSIGLADFNRQLISINSSHTEQTKKIAVYHEIIHIISDAYGLGLTEQQVKIGTHALLEFLNSNPDFTLSK